MTKNDKKLQKNYKWQKMTQYDKNAKITKNDKK